ncbi:unnamed protein product [Rotaria magnacalcarata]|uniref:SURF1-like protein n=2 Tax=Rotaria magnacalcarata TaxID=392030 RepID=A0A8S2JLM1_9BILA|nr:unnamed protein product [Rotaria magnacalcarata]CAF3915434.1 unnamed protein product [Rotaria magnacalcarata]
MLLDDVPDGTEVALVDHNENQQLMKILNKMRITHVIDHHKFGDLKTSDPIYLRFEPMAFLLTSAILSDTLRFRSPATTTDDRNILEYLIPLAKIDNITSYANSMFEVKSDLKGFSTRQIHLLDYKQYTFNNRTWGIGTGETCIKEKNLTLIPGDMEEKVVRQAFTANVNNHMMISRQFLFVRPYISNQLSVFRNVHISKPLCQSKNRAFTLAKRNKRDKVDSGAFILLIIPVSAFALGCWQVSRRTWKINLIEKLKSRTQAEPISLLENLDILPDLEYYPVHVRGTFDHSREILIQPRSRLDFADFEKQSAARPLVTTGAHVITPFRVANRNFDILVNRGFVPFELRDPSTRRAGQIEDEHEIIGLLRSTDTLNAVWSKNEPENNVWRTRDVAEMAAAIKTAPIFIDEIKILALY